MAEKQKDIKDWPVLYGKATTGKITRWWICAYPNEDGTATVHIKHGYVDGMWQDAPYAVKEGTNLGRSNERGPYEQACFEAEAKWNKQKDKGMVEDMAKVGDARLLLPMLAHPFEKYGKKVAYPARVQPKLNGVRCLAEKVSEDEINFLSRGGKSFNGTLKHLEPVLLKVMEAGEVWDGEIYRHDWNFQQIVRRVKKLRDDTNMLQYWVYDVVDEDKDYSERLNRLQAAIPEGLGVIKTPTLIIYCEDEVKALHDKMVANGFEGLIIRNAAGGYVLKHRSANLLKYKEFVDEEFEIVGGEEGVGSDEGCVTFKVANKDGKVFNVRPRGSVEQRRWWFQILNELIGKQLTVRYQGLSEDGIPIFPVGLCVRDFE